VEAVILVYCNQKEEKMIEYYTDPNELDYDEEEEYPDTQDVFGQDDEWME